MPDLVLDPFIILTDWVENQIVAVLSLPDNMFPANLELAEGWVSDTEDAHFLGPADTDVVTIQETEGWIS